MREGEWGEVGGLTGPCAPLMRWRGFFLREDQRAREPSSEPEMKSFPVSMAQQSMEAEWPLSTS